MASRNASMHRLTRRWIAVGSAAAAAASLWAGQPCARTASWSGHASDEDRGGFSAALVGPGEEGSSFWMNAGDWRDVERIRDDGGRPFLWFRLDGRAYVVRDPGLLERADEAVRESRGIGRRQGEIGNEQGRIGSQQGRIGGRQGRVGARQAMLSARMASLGRRLARFEEHADDARELRRALDDVRAELRGLATRLD